MSTRAEPMTQPSIFRLKVQALGTECQVLYYAPDMASAEAYRDAAVRWLVAFEAKYSRFRADSLISRINANAGQDWTEIDEEAESILALADGIAFLSGGILDPTTLPLTLLWKRAGQADRLPSTEELRAAKELVGWGKVERSPGRIRLPRAGMSLDLGGYGKEYAVDRVAEMAASFGITSLLVDFGRDLRCIGHPPDLPFWVVGVEDATQEGKIWERLGAKDRGVASSGNYRRYVEIAGQRFGHILDPRDGWPAASGCEGVTVIAKDCLEAGVLATTAFVLGPKDGLQLINRSFGAEGSIQAETKFETQQYHRYHVQTS